MLKKIVSSFLALAAIPTIVNYVRGADIELSAQSACLISYDTEETVFEKNAAEKLPMASTTKIMTCIVALEKGKKDDVVCVDSRAVGTEGSSVYLKIGDKLTLNDLLYAMMLQSANDAAAAIAYHISGSSESFAELMNAKAMEIGLKSTNFTNPHGLSDKEHYTCAEDLARLAVYALKNPAFAEIVSTKSYKIKIIDRTEITVINHNRLLNSYEGANGVKTGFTKASGRCLVSSATRGGISFVAVTLNAPDDWNDHKKMLDIGFAEYCTAFINKGQISHTINVAGYGSINITNRDDIKLILKNSSNVSYKIYAKHIEFAPLNIDTKIGYAKVYVDDVLRTTLPLYPDINVKEFTEKSKFTPFFNIRHKG